MQARIESGKPYILSWIALLVLTATSYGVDRLGLGRLGFSISLMIAACKALIVAVVFMHLRREPFAIRFVAVLNVLYVLLLCAGIAADVGAR